MNGTAVVECPSVLRIDWSEDDPIRVTVDYWPDRVLMVKHLVDEPDVDPEHREPGWVGVRRTGDQLRIVVDNGEATYRITGDAAMTNTYECEAVTRAWWGLAGA